MPAGGFVCGANQGLLCLLLLLASSMIIARVAANMYVLLFVKPLLHQPCAELQNKLVTLFPQHNMHCITSITHEHSKSRSSSMSWVATHYM